MSDAATDCVTACGLCIYAAFETWCTLHAFGADCCGDQRGCCGSCCDSSFNEDDFDEQMKREQARQGDNAQLVDAPPPPAQGMHVSNDAKPTTIVES